MIFARELVEVVARRFDIGHAVRDFGRVSSPTQRSGESSLRSKKVRGVGYWQSERH